MDHRFHGKSPDCAGGAQQRRRVNVRHSEFLLGGFIVTHDGRPALSCLVHDKSVNGVRLELETTRDQRGQPLPALPDYLTLYFRPTRTEVDCRIAWRDGRHIGIEFISKERPARLALALIAGA